MPSTQCERTGQSVYKGREAEQLRRWAPALGDVRVCVFAPAKQLLWQLP